MHAKLEGKGLADVPSALQAHVPAAGEHFDVAQIQVRVIGVLRRRWVRSGDQLEGRGASEQQQ